MMITIIMKTLVWLVMKINKRLRVLQKQNIKIKLIFKNRSKIFSHVNKLMNPCQLKKFKKMKIQKLEV